MLIFWFLGFLVNISWTGGVNTHPSTYTHHCWNYFQKKKRNPLWQLLEIMTRDYHWFCLALGFYPHGIYVHNKDFDSRLLSEACWLHLWSQKKRELTPASGITELQSHVWINPKVNHLNDHMLFPKWHWFQWVFWKDSLIYHLISESSDRWKPQY